MPSPRLSLLRPRLRRALRRRRRALALLAVLAAAMTVLPAFLPPHAESVRVVVAARDLEAGALLGTGDLTTTDVAAALAPAGGVRDPSAAVGHRLASALPRGMALTATQLRASDDPGLAPGRAVVAVPVDQALVPYLTAGSAVRVVTAAPDQPEARIVPGTVVDPGESAGQTAGSLRPGGGGTPVAVIAVPTADVATIAYATREGWVEIVRVH